jgi:GNAT superfamily N-acetyltransferase
VIRAFRDEDADAAVGVLREAALDWYHSPASLLHRLSSHPPRARQLAWVAEEEGEIVGFARARFRWEVSERTVGWLWLGVRPDRRRLGFGGALYERAARHLAEAGAEVLESFAAEEGGRRFLGSRGFRATGVEHISRLDVSEADVAPLAALEEVKAAEGFRLAALGEVLDRAREVHAVYAATLADVPEAFATDDLRYDEWELECLGDPDLSREGSTVVLHDGKPVALSFLVADGEGRAANDMTGTLPEYRRRGLARLAKLGTIRWAVAGGADWILTGNDEENPAMRGLNEILGYRPAGTQTLYVREAP